MAGSADSAPADGAGRTADVAGRPRRRLVRARTIVALGAALALVIAVGYFGYVGYEGSRITVYGDDVAHGCQTPATLGWAYEAVNYDIADDARLQRVNHDWLADCALDRGAGTAGSAVVASDGTRLAGWYIPSANGAPPTAATVVIVHGWGVSKTDALRYAALLHGEFNLLLPDLRASGRSSGDQHTWGVREQDDLRAMIDWLVRTKRPAAIGVLGDLGGAATAVTLARRDARIAALVLESAHSRIVNPFEQRLARAAPPVYPSVWVMEIGIWLRTGAWPGDADPINSIRALGLRPLAISYGTADSTDLPDRNALVLADAARAAGVPVEVHACDGAEHGRVVDTCFEAYRAWVVPFFRRALAGA